MFDAFRQRFAKKRKNLEGVKKLKNHPAIIRNGVRTHEPEKVALKEILYVGEKKKPALAQ